MIKRIAITIGSLAAAGVLAVGLAVAGFGPASDVDAGQGDPPTVADTPQLPLADPVVDVETIYVRPAPKPAVINITRRVPATASRTARPQPRVTRERDDDHEGREHEGREHEGREHEGGRDDD